MRKFLIICLIVGGVGLAFFIYFNRVSSSELSQKERVNAEKNILGRAIRTNRASGVKNYTGKYFSFSYPAWVSVDTRDDATVQKNPSILQLFELRDPATHLFIVTQVSVASTTTLSDESAVKLRRSQSDVYTESAVTLSGYPGIAFTKNQDGAEKSIFILANSRLYSLAATALSKESIDDPLPEILKTIVIR